MRAEFRWRYVDEDEVPPKNGVWNTYERVIVLQVRYPSDGFTEGTFFMGKWTDIKIGEEE